MPHFYKRNNQNVHVIQQLYIPSQILSVGFKRLTPVVSFSNLIPHWQYLCIIYIDTYIDRPTLIQNSRSKEPEDTSPNMAFFYVRLSTHSYAFNIQLAISFYQFPWRAIMNHFLSIWCGIENGVHIDSYYLWEGAQISGTTVVFEWLCLKVKVIYGM